MTKLTVSRIEHSQYRFIVEVSLIEPGTTEPFFPSEDDALRVTAWCKEAKIGRRVSYDQWTFKNEQDMTAFILRWNNVQI